MKSMTLLPGSFGPFVRDMQVALNNRLNPSPNLMVSGIFDTATGRAVRLLQTAKWLEVDGVAGQGTLDALFDTETSRPILHDVRFLTQPTEITCWATSTAMLKGCTIAAIQMRSGRRVSGDEQSQLVGLHAGDGGLRFQAVEEGDLDLFGARDHVQVGEDHALVDDHHAGRLDTGRRKAGTGRHAGMGQQLARHFLVQLLLAGLGGGGRCGGLLGLLGRRCLVGVAHIAAVHAGIELLLILLALVLQELVDANAHHGDGQQGHGDHRDHQVFIGRRAGMDRAAGPDMGAGTCGWHGWKAVNAMRLPGYRQVRRLSEIQTVRVGQSREYGGDGSA